MKQNLYNKANKANSKLYQANYDRIFNNTKKQAPEPRKVQRSKQGAYQGKREIVDWKHVTKVLNAMLHSKASVNLIES